MTRAIILVADGLGIGAAKDAEAFGDVGSNTFYHIYQHLKDAHQRTLDIPNLTKLGLVKACEQASGQLMPEYNETTIEAAFGYMQEISSGKDTPSGHWEMAGVPVLFDWGYFTDKTNSFPSEFLKELEEKTGIRGTLGNKHAPGTDILVEFGEEHIQSGKPICYTSVDSVFQIAAHETHFGLERLYDYCQAARELLDKYNIGRVIARPFEGESPETFKRTGNRRDFSVLPPNPTVLDKLTKAGGQVISIGKIADIYAHQGISTSIKATGLEQLLDKTSEQIQQASDNSIIFTNLVNFDQDYGHRRDIVGYANALEYFDIRLGQLLQQLKPRDVLFITADHGCDPSWVGTDHTREFVPILCAGPEVQPQQLGLRHSFADMGQTIAELFELTPMQYGDSFVEAIS